MAHRRHSPARRKKTRQSWFAMGALLGALPPCAWARNLLHLSPGSPTTIASSSIRRKVEAALAHVKIWTPSETLLTAPAVAAQDRASLVTHAADDVPSGHAAVEQGAPVFRFAIPRPVPLHRRFSSSKRSPVSPSARLQT